MRTRPLVTAGARGAIAAALPFGESTGRSAAHVPVTGCGVRPRRSSAAVKTEAVVAFTSPRRPPRPPCRSYCLLLLRAALRSYSLHAAKGAKVTLQFDEFYQVRFNHERHVGMKRCVASQRHPVPLREAPPRPGALAAADLLLLPRRCLFLDFHRNRGKQCGISCARRLPLNRVFVRTPPRCCDLGSSVSS